MREERLHVPGLDKPLGPARCVCEFRHDDGDAAPTCLVTCNYHQAALRKARNDALEEMKTRLLREADDLWDLDREMRSGVLRAAGIVERALRDEEAKE